MSFLSLSSSFLKSYSHSKQSKELGALAVPTPTDCEKAERTLSYLTNKPQTTDTTKMSEDIFLHVQVIKTDLWFFFLQANRTDH